MSILPQGWWKALHDIRCQSCFSCNNPSQRPLCDSCLDAVPTMTPHGQTGDLLQRPYIHQHLVKPTYHHLYCWCDYEWPISELLKQLKFHQRMWPVPVLADGLWRTVCHGHDGPLPECLVPIPLHWRRLMGRHYNQSALLAKALGRLSGIAVNDGLLKRHRATRRQADLTASARRANLRRAFSASDVVPYQRIALIDDTLTTGSTVNEAARALLRQQPTLTIEVWTVAISLWAQ